MSSAPAIAVTITGASGRVGKRLVAAVAEDAGLTLTGATEVPGHPELGRDAGELAGVRNLGVPLTANLEPLLGKTQVVIDFTGPQASLAHLRQCADRRVAMVIGTTGLSAAQTEEVRGLAARVPVVLAPNMSMGVNLLFHLVREAAQTLGPGFDIEVVEAHHRLKKDAPSGTALRLAAAAAEGRNWPFPEAARFCREGMIGERPEREIGVQTVRAGDIVGDHTVIFAGPGERIEFIHRAHSRDTFARGAVRAVHWIAGRNPGLYDMLDVLGLRSNRGS